MLPDGGRAEKDSFYGGASGRHKICYQINSYLRPQSLGYMPKTLKVYSELCCRAHMDA